MDPEAAIVSLVGVAVRVGVERRVKVRIPSGLHRRWPWTADPVGVDVVATVAGLPAAGCAHL